MSILELKNVSKSYGAIKAISQVNLKVNPGETIAILGPNGAGKTTLLKIMAGLLQPDEGIILYRGKPVNEEVDKLRRRVTMVFQRPVMFSTSVYGNVAYGLKVRGLPQKEVKAKVRGALKLVGLEEFESRQAKKLSGGEQQKVALARALVTQPEVLLLDEPTSNLDSPSAASIEQILKRIKLKTVIVLVTHNVFQAKRLAERIIYMSSGVVIEDSSAQEFFRQPKSLEASKFISGETFF
jgi:tungstate transport system ATP-binding protein